MVPFQARQRMSGRTLDPRQCWRTFSVLLHVLSRSGYGEPTGCVPCSVDPRRREERLRQVNRPHGCARRATASGCKCGSAWHLVNEMGFRPLPIDIDMAPPWRERGTRGGARVVAGSKGTLRTPRRAAMHSRGFWNSNSRAL
ncbi:hypothetical protein BT67DRAFT_121532 [Trichocladium antarcticum]|uniref:Uncharacterized protein n=1 Tax=Trichocladium antarcticum TaxID=1450529 RepID=A0AAN6URB6_9PEZI|nr:hypothetical protein BT67DRAFT_121532 [Trichocladium antarcticum]